MSRDSGADQPTQRTVAELLAEYGGSAQKGSRRRRRRAEDPTETAPQAIIDRVLSDSGQMRAVNPDAEPSPSRSQRSGPQHPQPSAPQPPAASAPQPPLAAPLQAAPVAPSAPEALAPEPGPGAPPGGGAAYWAQRFSGADQDTAAAPAAPTGSAAPTVPPEGDVESTIQQPALRRSAPPQDGPPPAPPAPPKPIPPEGMTEQLPRVPAPSEPDPEGTAVLAYPAAPQQEESAEPEDPYDFEDYDEPEAEYVEDDYDPELPAGLDADDYLADEVEEEPSARREWGTLAVQGVVGLVGGGLLWVGFRWLWETQALAALGAALAITGLLVFIAWKFLRTNDLQTILLAVLVGLFCTVSPAALLLFSHS
jgi:hypothetical protein